MDRLEWTAFVFILLVALASVVFTVWATIAYAKLPTRSFLGYGASMGLFGVIGSLMALIQLFARWVESSTPAFVFIVTANVLLQPLFLWICVVSSYKIYMGLTGRFCYAFRVIPPEVMSPEQYAQLRRYGILQAVVGLVCMVAMSGGCLWPLL
jgi:hypothetical protein